MTLLELNRAEVAALEQQIQLRENQQQQLQAEINQLQVARRVKLDAIAEFETANPPQPADEKPPEN